MEKEIIYGGCYCGNIRYKAFGAPIYSGVCYCNDCRRVAGAQSVAWLTYLIEDFEFTKGEPTVYKSSEKVTRTFCNTCSTSLTYQLERRKTQIDITTASTDTPNKYPPGNLAFPNEKLEWDIHLDLPEYD